MAPGRGPAGAPVFEDEFFRQLVGGTLNEPVAPAQSSPAPAPAPAPAARAERAARRAEPAARLAGVMGRVSLPPALRGVRRGGALAVGAIVLVGAFAIGRGGGAPGSEGVAEQGPAIRSAAPANLGGAAGADAAERTELLVRWAGAPRREASGVARRKVAWIRDGRLSIFGAVRTPGGYRAEDGPIAVLASDGSDGEGEQPKAKVGELKPDASGRFQADVALDRGAPRKLLTFVYARAGDRAPLATAKAVLEVEGGLALEGRRSGRAVALSGRTRPGEAFVRVEARAPGSAWSEHSVLRSDARGDWRVKAYLPRPLRAGRYDFRVTMRGDAAAGFLAARRSWSAHVGR